MVARGQLARAPRRFGALGAGRVRGQIGAFGAGRVRGQTTKEINSEVEYLSYKEIVIGSIPIFPMDELWGCH